MLPILERFILTSNTLLYEKRWEIIKGYSRCTPQWKTLLVTAITYERTTPSTGLDGPPYRVQAISANISNRYLLIQAKRAQRVVLTPYLEDEREAFSI